MRERLQGLMLFRVVLVTVFLSSALIADSTTLEDLSRPNNLTLLLLIVGTYALTIVYGLYLRRPAPRLTQFGHFQLSADFITGAILVVATGGLRGSIFVPVFFLPIISAALVLGRSSALYVCTSVTSLILALSAFELGLFDGVDANRSLQLGSPRTILLEAGMLSSFAYLLAFVSGRLAEQLDVAELQLERQRIDLDELRELNANILSSMDSGLLTINETGLVIFANTAAQRITGLDEKQFFGAPIEQVLPELAAHLNEESERLDVTHVHPDGNILHLGFSTSELRTQDDLAHGKIIIFQDLTHVRALEHNAKRAERLAAIGELAASIAHEIRNPLGAISGSVELLQIMKDSPEDQAELMDVVVREVDRLNHLITEFLEYSKPRSLRPNLVDPEALVQEVVSMFLTGHPDIELDTVGSSHGPPLWLDEEISRQILWNLLHNGVEAQLEQDDGSPIRLYVDIQSAPDRISICVEDDGPGVPEELSEKIFEPFFTTKATGTGLGLATIYRLANEHLGAIELEPPVRLGGARFVVHLGALPYEPGTPT